MEAIATEDIDMDLNISSINEFLNRISYTYSLSKLTTKNSKNSLIVFILIRSKPFLLSKYFLIRTFLNIIYSIYNHDIYTNNKI